MLKLLNKALAIGQAISEQMLKGNWQNIDALQKQQSNIIEEIEASELPSGETDISETKRLSLQIQALTEQQLRISHNRKDKLFQKIKMNNSSKKMYSAYSQNS